METVSLLCVGPGVVETPRARLKDGFLPLELRTQIRFHLQELNLHDRLEKPASLPVERQFLMNWEIGY